MSYLHQLFDRPGPWVSVYLDATRAEQNTDRQLELHWRSLRDNLERQNADAATLDAVEAAVREHPYRPGRYGLAVFATAGEVALVEPMSAPPAADEAVFGPLPHAMPLVAQRVDEIPYVRALTDRTGAEVTGLTVDGSPRREHVKGGEDYPIHKVRRGGWSNPRYQQAAEETWKRNAGDVAAAVAELAARVGAEVVVVAGDVRATTLVTEKLPRRWQARVVVSHSSGEEDLDEVTVQAIADVARRHHDDAIDRFNAQGPGPSGLADVVTRLQRGQADTVLLANNPSSTDKLWIGTGDPSLIAVDAQTLRESGVDEPQQVRADAALLRAIVGTGADLVLVSPDEVRLTHGIGAALRYPDGATAAS